MNQDTQQTDWPVAAPRRNGGKFRSAFGPIADRVLSRPAPIEPPPTVDRVFQPTDVFIAMVYGRYAASQIVGVFRDRDSADQAIETAMADRFHWRDGVVVPFTLDTPVPAVWDARPAAEAPTPGPDAV